MAGVHNQGLTTMWLKKTLGARSMYLNLTARETGFDQDKEERRAHPFPDGHFFQATINITTATKEEF